jgi:hypothetical protein
MAVNTTRFPLRGTQPRSASRRAPSPHPRDDEILGLVTTVARPARNVGEGLRSGSPNADSMRLGRQTLPGEAKASPLQQMNGALDGAAPAQSAPQSSVAQSGATNPSAPSAVSPQLARLCY